MGRVCLKIHSFLSVPLKFIWYFFIYGMQNKDRFSRGIMSWDAFVVRNSHAILHTQVHGCLELVFKLRQERSKAFHTSGSRWA